MESDSADPETTDHCLMEISGLKPIESWLPHCSMSKMSSYECHPRNDVVVVGRRDAPCAPKVTGSNAGQIFETQWSSYDDSSPIKLKIHKFSRTT